MPIVHTWLVPQLIRPELLRGGVAVVIDQLRATTTITQALANGAKCVIPCVEVDEARRRKAELEARGERVLAGGERNGVLIEGFDLDNSPVAYTRERVQGATIVFSTTNGTAAIHAGVAAGARRVVLASLANLSGIVRLLKADALAHGPATHAHLVCAGTRAEVSQEDVLVAGAIVARLRDHAWDYSSDDSSRLVERLWIDAHSDPAGVLHALHNSRGGRNLHRLGLEADIQWCVRIDSLASTVGEFDVAGAPGRITLNPEPSP